MKQTKITTKTIAFVAVLAAIYFVLGTYLHVENNNFNASIQTLPVLIGAFTLGPVPAMFIGIIGEFLKQLIMYGIDPTTPLWILPYALEGLLAGLLVKKEFGNISNKKLIIAIIISEVFLTLIITPVNTLAAVLQGWGTWTTILAGLGLRLVIMAIKIVIYCLVIPVLYKSLKKVVK